MKNTYLFIFLYSLSAEAFCCPKIIGTWKSSLDLSLKYNTENLDLESRTIEFMKQVYGVLTLTYDEEMVRSHGAPTKKIMVSGKEYDFVYEEMKYPYEVLSCTDDTLTIKEDSPYMESTEVKHFIDSNTYWVPAMPESEKREYFIRVSN
jgi:hypothetical protein